MSKKALFEVWLAKDPTFGGAEALGRKPEVWPYDYERVGDVLASSLEEVFAVTQTWEDDNKFVIYREPVRSTSVGDVIVTSDGAVYELERGGCRLIDYVGDDFDSPAYWAVNYKV